MKIYKLPVTTLICLLLISCSFESDYEKYVDQTDECMEDLDGDYVNMRDAIAAFDFEAAHQYFACYQPGYFDRKGDFSGMDDEEEKYGPSDLSSPKEKAATDLAKAEITYYVAQNEQEKAKSVAQELSREYLYAESSINVFSVKLDQMIKSNQYDDIFRSMINIKQAINSTPYDTETSIEAKQNQIYNNIVRSYNSLLDNVLSQYKYNKVSKSNMKALIDLSVPELFSKVSWECYLENRFKNTAGEKYLE